MLDGKNLIDITDEGSSRISRNANILGEMLTKAGFENVEVSFSLTIKTKSASTGNSKIERKGTFNNYNYCSSVAKTNSPPAPQSPVPPNKIVKDGKIIGTATGSNVGW